MKRKSGVRERWLKIEEGSGQQAVLCKREYEEKYTGRHTRLRRIRIQDIRKAYIARAFSQSADSAPLLVESLVGKRWTIYDQKLKMDSECLVIDD